MEEIQQPLVLAEDVREIREFCCSDTLSEKRLTDLALRIIEHVNNLPEKEIKPFFEGQPAFVSYSRNTFALSGLLSFGALCVLQWPVAFLSGTVSLISLMSAKAVHGAFHDRHVDLLGQLDIPTEHAPCILCWNNRDESTVSEGYDGMTVTETRRCRLSRAVLYHLVMIHAKKSIQGKFLSPLQKEVLCKEVASRLRSHLQADLGKILTFAPKIEEESLDKAC